MTDTPENLELTFPDNSNGEDAPLLADEIFNTLVLVADHTAMAHDAWPIWILEPTHHRGMDMNDDEWESVDTTELEDGAKSACISIAATDTHPMGYVVMPVAARDASDKQLLAQAHTIAGKIEQLKAAVPDTAIETYLEWIRSDGLPDRIEKNLNISRPRWHRILIDHFLPQYPHLWDAPPDPEDMPIWRKQIETDYGIEAGRVVVAANALHANTKHALQMAHEVVHDQTAWEQYARDAIAHAAMWLADVTDPNTGDLDIEASIRASLAPPVMARAIIYLGAYWAGDALNRYRYALWNDIRDNPGRWKELIKQARADLGLPPVEIHLGRVQGDPVPTLTGKPFNPDDHGFVWMQTHGPMQLVPHRLARLEQWERRTERTPPETTLEGYGVSGSLHIAGDTGLRLWNDIRTKAAQAKQRGDILPDVFIAVTAIIAGHKEGLDLFGTGSHYIARDWLMKALGINKTHDYDIEKAHAALQAIGDISSRGVRTAHIGGKQVLVPFDGPLWRVMETIPKAETMQEIEAFLRRDPDPNYDPLYNTPVPPLSIAGWTIAAGANLIQGIDETPQLARVRHTLMSYSAVHGRYKRRLGLFLTLDFKVRKEQGTWEQPYRISNLLDRASLEVDDKNPKRSYNQFHEAMYTLERDGIIGRWDYVKAPKKRPKHDPHGKYDPGYNTGTRGWKERWLDAGIVILPPDDIHARYLEDRKESKRRSKRRRAIPANTTD